MKDFMFFIKKTVACNFGNDTTICSWFFLSGFSFTDTDDSQDSRGRERRLYLPDFYSMRFTTLSIYSMRFTTLPPDLLYEIYSVNLCIQSEYRKTRTRKSSAFGNFSRSVQLHHLSAFYYLRSSLFMLHQIFAFLSLSLDFLC